MNTFTHGPLLGALLLLAATRTRRALPGASQPREPRPTPQLGNTVYDANSGGGDAAPSLRVQYQEQHHLHQRLHQSAYLGIYTGGSGVTNRDGATSAGDAYEGTITNSTAPGHAMDNELRYDSMLFDFGSSAKLNSVTVGSWCTDSI